MLTDPMYRMKSNNTNCSAGYPYSLNRLIVVDDSKRDLTVANSVYL